MLAAIGRGHGSRPGLFAYPAQSNFSGVRHPLAWVARAQAAGYDVLLDAAAYVPTSRLDLSIVQPEFVAISWYKVFGFPTGVGCLLARHDALARLRRPWFAGGTIMGVSVDGGWHRMLEGEAGFEDGTVNFLSIPDVTVGLDWISGVGIDLIHQRVGMLTSWLLDCLGRMRHSSGAPMVRVYGPPTGIARGGTVALNFLDPDGQVIDERAVSRDSSAAGISLRTGCFCNPGAGRGGVRAHPAGPARGRAGDVARARHSRHGPLPVAGRAADRRRGPGLARRRLDARRRGRVPRLRRAHLPRPPSRPGRPCRRATAARRCRQAAVGRDGSRR